MARRDSLVTAGSGSGPGLIAYIDDKYVDSCEVFACPEVNHGPLAESRFVLRFVLAYLTSTLACKWVEVLPYSPSKRQGCTRK
jgi:hypothetical protein